MSNQQKWFNEYQEVEDYIIDRIGGNFLEATPEKFKTASEATIDLLSKMYTEKEMIDFAWWFFKNRGQFNNDHDAHFEGRYLQLYKEKHEKDRGNS